MRKIIIYCLILFSLFENLKGLSQANHEVSMSSTHNHNHLKQDSTKVDRRLKNQTLPQNEQQDYQQDTDANETSEQSDQSNQTHHHKHLKQDSTKVDRRLKNQTLSQNEQQDYQQNNQQNQTSETSEEDQHLAKIHQKQAAAVVSAPKHEFYQIIQIAIELYNLYNLIQSMTHITCSQTGYLRSTYITVSIKNGSKITQLTNYNRYQDSGKSYQLPAEKNIYVQGQAGLKQMVFVKTSGSATGSCGVNMWDIGGTNKRLVIVYENPWSSWDFFAVCILPKTSAGLTPTQMEALYDKIYDDADTIIDDNQPDAYFKDSNCIYSSNYWVQKTILTTHTKIETLNGVTFGVAGTYGKSQKSNTGYYNCYEQSIDVFIQ